MNAVLVTMAAGAVLSQGDGQLTIPHCDLGHCTQEWWELKTEHVEGVLEPAARTLTVRASAYTHTGSRTATGTYPRFGTVAVDPRVIPLGSRLTIEGFPGVIFRAEDTGGAVVGNKIDIFMDTRAECIQFGVQTRVVTVLR